MKSIKNIFLFTAAILLHTVSSDTTSQTVKSDQQITFYCGDGDGAGTCCTSEGSFKFPNSDANFYCQDQNGKTCCSTGDNFGCNEDSCKVDCTDCEDVSVSSADGTDATEGGGDDVSSGNTGSGDEAVDSEIGGDVTEGAGDQVTDSEIGTDGGSVTMGTGDQVSDSTIDGEAPVESSACSGNNCGGGGGWGACSGPDCNSGQVSTLAMATTVGILFAAAFLSI